MFFLRRRPTMPVRLWAHPTIIRHDESVRIGMLAVDDCMASALAGLGDAFALAEALARQSALNASFEASVLAIEPSDVRGFGGASPKAMAWREAPPCDVLIVPPIMRSVEHLTEHPSEVFDRLRAQAQANRAVAAVCSGTFLLAEAGLLTGKIATTSHFLVPAFKRRFPEVRLRPEQRLTVDTRVTCAGATTSWLSLAIHFIEQEAGHQLAVLVSKYLMVDPNPDTPLPYLLLQPARDHGDREVLVVQERIERAFDRELTIDGLAAAAGMSRRSLTRRFRAATGDSPLEYVRRVRLETAKRLLESERLSVEEVTTKVGYTDPRSFTRLFRSHTGISPGEYRRRFGLRHGNDVADLIESER